MKSVSKENGAQVYVRADGGLNRERGFYGSLESISGNPCCLTCDLEEDQWKKNTTYRWSEGTWRLDPIPFSWLDQGTAQMHRLPFRGQDEGRSVQEEGFPRWKVHREEP